MIKTLFILPLLAVLFWPGLTASAEDILEQTLSIPYKGSKLLELTGKASQISVSDSKILGVKLLEDRDLLVTGKKLGEAHITVLRSNNTSITYKVRVEIPAAALKEKLRAVLPRSPINIDAVGRSLVLSGEVADPIVSQRATKLVQAYLRGLDLDATVLNFLTIRGLQQVQLRVKIAEVSRSSLRQLGVNYWFRESNTKSAGGILAPGTQLNTNLAPSMGETGTALQPGGTMTPVGAVPQVPMLSPAFSTDAFGLLFATQAGSSFPMSIAVNLLHHKGLAKILSEPTLVAYSGQKAKFLAGGEFPVPIPQSLGTVGIEYKKFGVQLEFTPTVLAKNTIHLKVSVAVSDKDQSGSVQIQGTTVPALSTRHSETTVRLKSGQSFAIAGLLHDKQANSNSKIPLLGDIPLIGMLFRKSAVQRQETELVILATAHAVQPLQAGKVPPLPGEDEFSDPSSLSFFLLGTIDADEPRKPDRGPAGPVGFSK